jgi:hypothetical protein
MNLSDEEEEGVIPEKGKIFDEETKKEITVKLKGLDFELLERERKRIEAEERGENQVSKDKINNSKEKKNTINEIKSLLQ